MRNQAHELPTTEQRMTTTTPATTPARYPAGPSKGRLNGGPSAPGVAEGLGHQGAPER